MDTLRLCQDLLHAVESSASTDRGEWLQLFLERLRSELGAERLVFGEARDEWVRRSLFDETGFHAWTSESVEGVAAVADLETWPRVPTDLGEHPALTAEFRPDDSACSATLDRSVRKSGPQPTSGPQTQIQFTGSENGSLVLRRVPRTHARSWLVAADSRGIKDWPSDVGSVLELGCEFLATALAHEKKTRELEELAMTDGLTLIPNYRFLRQVLRVEMDRARRYGEVFSVVMVDVDNLKQYNAAHGHLAGSEILQKVAEILRADVRGADTVAKYGGDEFLIVLPRTLATGALALSERIRRRVNERLIGRGGEKISCSFGVASFPKDGFDYEGLIASADRVLYEAKHQGRNRVVWTGEIGTGGISTGSEAERVREMKQLSDDGLGRSEGAA